MKITVLIDNRSSSCHNGNTKQEESPGNCLGSAGTPFTEHGLSFYIEFENFRLLCDTGASGQFISNAKEMGIDLSGIDFCFISHGHSDHSGGLGALLEYNPKCKIYLAGEIFNKRYFSLRSGRAREISTDHTIKERYPSNISPLERSCKLSNNIAFIKNSYHKFPRPKGNRHLISKEEGEFQDEFSHEFSLVFKTPEGVIIISPCSHNGIFNIIESAFEFMGSRRLCAYIGGLHLVDGEEEPGEIEAIATIFKSDYSNARLFTCHCTGEKALGILSGSLSSDRFTILYSGSTLTL